MLLKVGDAVMFSFNGKRLRGTVYVMDSEGGGVFFGASPSCDIKANNGVLYKHIPLDEIDLIKSAGAECN